MAIDTRSKRTTAQRYSGSPVYPAPDGAIAAADRATVNRIYYFVPLPVISTFFVTVTVTDASSVGMAVTNASSASIEVL